MARLPPNPLARSTPVTQRRQALARSRFRLLPFRSPLLREYSLFLGVLRCFSSPGSLDSAMYSRCRDGVSPPPGCPIRTPLDHGLPAAPQGVSSRGHVLLRPQTPRHPPCAFVTFLRRLLSSVLLLWWWLPSVSGPGHTPPPCAAHCHPPDAPEQSPFRQMSSSVSLVKVLLRPEMQKKLKRLESLHN